MVTHPKVVILGAGFGGLSAAKTLGNSSFDVTVIDRSNHHLFQPLLYQVATAMLSPADIAVPVRHQVARFHNIRVKMLEVTGIDPEKREVVCEDYRESYDRLIVATGAQNHYFGHPWENKAPSLKTLADALSIRVKILSAFERAELEMDLVLRAKYLTFVIVGGGPTGVELAGAVAELAHHTVVKDFKIADSRSSRICLIEAGPRILASFCEDSSMTAQRSLADLGVEVLKNKRVLEIGDGFVLLDGGEKIESHTILWAAGVKATAVADWLGQPTDRMGRVRVNDDLTLPGYENVFVIGDAALCVGENGAPLPGVAPVAMQQGRFVARKILGRADRFYYHDKGSLATIGRRRAVAEFGRFRLSGFPAWIAWIAIHIYYLIGFRNRMIVLLEWAWAYFTRERGARLISIERNTIRSGET